MTLKNCLTIVALTANTAFAQNSTTLKSGIQTSNMNPQAKPGMDFYEYACGGWMQAHPLPAEFSRFGSFDKLAEDNREQLRDLIVSLSQQENQSGSLGQKIGTLYHIAMDSAKLNKEGITPILPILTEIKETNQRKDIQPLMAKLYRMGIPSMFGVYIGADIKESENNLVQVGQGGLSLGQKEYYLDSDEQTLKIREAFKQHLVKMFELAGNTPQQAEKKMEAVMRIETRIAHQTYDATKRRDPEANYHKMSFSELQKEYPGIDWTTYLNIIGMTPVYEVSIGQPEPIHEVELILAETPIEDIQALLEWKTINSASSYLSDDFRAATFDFFGRTMSGRQEDQERWKRSVSTVDGVLGEAVGKLYVEKYFPEEAKQRMLQLVTNLQTALGERIQAQEWMSDETKKLAMEKLGTFHVKIGYPDKWRDYSALEIKDDSYWANIVRSNELDMDYLIQEKLNKPVDQEEWFMTPQTVNAYYNPTTNEICFPAGILQYPFFDMQADDAFNYGAIGVVIGHEMTHGFDDKGRQFDKKGNLTDWWTPEDAERFKERTLVMEQYFDTIDVLPDLKANGKLTLGENLADHGGVRVAYQALKNATKNAPLPVVEGLTPEQRFFLAYANVWAGNIRDEEIRKRTKSDPHSLGRWRVNGALPHIDAWYEAFGIQPTDSMYIPKEKRADIW